MSGNNPESIAVGDIVKKKGTGEFAIVEAINEDEGFLFWGIFPFVREPIALFSLHKSNRNRQKEANGKV